MWPDRAQGAFFPSAFPGLPVCWNVGRLGIFTARIFPSQSDRFQLEPGDSSRRGRGCRRGRGQTRGSPSCSALGAWTQFPSFLGNANIRLPIGPGQGEPGLLELRGSGEAAGGLGDQRLNLSEARTWLAVSHRASLPPDGKCVRKGYCLDSILRWGCACQTQVLGPVGATQPRQEVASLSLSPVSVLHSVGHTAPPGPGSLS